jgi:hypothetical protein
MKGIVGANPGDVIGGMHIVSLSTSLAISIIMMLVMIMAKPPITGIQLMFPFTLTHINAKMCCMPIEHLITIFFTALGAANYLPISITVIMGICLLKSVRSRVTVISNNIIRYTWCSVIFASYYVLACDLDWGRDG